MNRPAWRVLALATLAGTLAACGDRPPPADVVARVGHVDIRYAEFEEHLRRHAIEPEIAVESAALSALFDQFLEEWVIRRLAVDRGLVAADASSAAALQALIDEAAETAVPEVEVSSYYREHPERFEMPERVQLAQILTETRAAADEALAELSAGVPFDEVARRISREPAAGLGGDQGILAREDLPPAFVDAVFSLGEGEVSEVVQADYGFHIFRVTRRLPADRLPFEAAAPEIRRQLSARRAAEARLRLVRQAFDRYNPRVYDGNLPFPYRPRGAGRLPGA